MSQPAARVGDMHVCPMVTPGIPTIPHFGGPILPPGVPTVFIGGLPAATITSQCICIGPLDIVIKGSISVLLSSKPASRMGDSTAHGGAINIGCPTVFIGGPSVVVPANVGLGIPSEPPATSNDAQEIVILPTDINEQMRALWDQSFPGGRSQEFGGTLVRDADGNLLLINTGGGTAGTFQPNESVGPDHELIGVFHTHPYDETEGGATNVSLSGGDAAAFINGDNMVEIVQSGDGQFMYVRTGETPDNVDYNTLDNEQNQRVQELINGGESFDTASQIAARETAENNNMAYYEGREGVFRRVYP